MRISPGSPFRLCLLMSAVNLLVACAAKTGTEASSAGYIGWHCDDARLKRGEPCEPVRVVNGRQRVLLESGRESAADTSAEAAPDHQRIARTRELILVGDLRQRTWQGQLPGFTVEATEKPDVPSPDIRDDTTPVPEPAFADDLYAAYAARRDDPATGDKGHVSPGPQPESEDVADAVLARAARQDQEPRAESEPRARPQSAGQPPARLQTQPESESRSGYTVQLGAFASAEEAERFLEQHRLMHLDITRGRYDKGGRRWHVLSYGIFTDVRSAEQGWAAAAGNAADLKVWIRQLRR